MRACERSSFSFARKTSEERCHCCCQLTGPQPQLNQTQSVNQQQHNVTSSLCQGHRLLNCIVLGALGLRNIVAPGQPIPIFPGDAAGQKHFFAGLEASELSPGQMAYSNILGFALLGLVASKMTTLFSGKEGTFLRRNLLIAFGTVDIVMSASMLRFEKGFQVAGASIKGLSLLHFVEGAAFLYDALYRSRPVKPSSKVSKER